MIITKSYESQISPIARLAPCPLILTKFEIIKQLLSINNFKLTGTVDIDLKKASKAFATKFSCGSSVTGDDEIVIQGDVCDEVADYITVHWSDVSRLIKIL